MKKIFILLLLFPLFLQAQEYYQYFDGADTSSWNSIEIDFGTDTNNIWQIGRPQKIIFDTAATFPNALVTDTMNNYPINDTSSFEIHLKTSELLLGGLSDVFAFQWQQKLDYDTLFDGGMIEFSIDSGQTWENAINSPFNYNFYGFNAENLDTLQNGEYVFTGTDSTWKNIWICTDYGWLQQYETLDFRFTSISDGIDNQKEGWMIDNMAFITTIAHTLKTVEQEEYIVAYPNPTNDKLFINVLRSDEAQYIEKLEVLNINGQVIETLETLPIKYFIDTKDYPTGNYFLKVKTNVKTETMKFSIER